MKKKVLQITSQIWIDSANRDFPSVSATKTKNEHRYAQEVNIDILHNIDYHIMLIL